MNKFLTDYDKMYPELPDATNFDGIELIPKPERGPENLCPLCKGHGKWNTRLNTRGPGQHTMALCDQCWGWGWVIDADATCIHDFHEIKPSQPWRCWHTIQCKKCGRKRDYDSSD